MDGCGRHICKMTTDIQEEITFIPNRLKFKKLTDVGIISIVGMFGRKRRKICTRFERN